MSFRESGQGEINANGVVFKLPTKGDLCNLIGKWADADRQRLIADLTDSGVDAAEKLKQLRDHDKRSRSVVYGIDCVNDFMRRTDLLLTHLVSGDIAILAVNDEIDAALRMFGFNPSEVEREGSGGDPLEPTKTGS